MAAANRQIRIWIALNKRNRQIVSFHIADGSKKSSVGQVGIKG